MISCSDEYDKIKNGINQEKMIDESTDSTAESNSNLTPSNTASIVSNDTTTQSGYTIKYHVSSQNQNDLIISWSNETISDSIIVRDILALHDPDHIPTFYFENANYIILEHDCAATECLALYLIPKHAHQSPLHLSGITEMIDNNIIIYTEKTSSTSTTDIFAFNMDKMKKLSLQIQTPLTYITVKLQHGNELIISGIEEATNETILETKQCNW